MTPPVLTFATSDREQVFTPQDISTALAALPLPALTPPLGLSEPSPGTPNSENFERQDSPLLALPVPARRSHSMLLTMPHAGDLGCKRVLIVDDNTVNQSVLRAMVMKIGVPAEVAGDGEVALRMCVQSQFRYGLILMDSHMPRLSGIECTRLLRETEQRGGHARQPVVLFTADDCRGCGARRRTLMAVCINRTCARMCGACWSSSACCRTARRSTLLWTTENNTGLPYLSFFYILSRLVSISVPAASLSFLFRIS